FIASVFEWKHCNAFLGNLRYGKSCSCEIARRPMQQVGNNKSECGHPYEGGSNRRPKFCPCTKRQHFSASAVFEFLRQLQIAAVSSVEICYVNGLAVLDCAHSQIVQVRTPLPRVCEIFGCMFRHKNVSRISAIHYSLRSVNSATRYVCPAIDISNLVD